MSSSSNIKTLHSVTTTENADCVETCPKPGQNGEIVIACGMYQLEEELLDTGEMKQSRRGRVNLYVIDMDKPALKLDSSVSTKCSGILDMKWMDADEKCLLVTAHADGHIGLYEFDTHGTTYTLPRICHTKISELLLFVDVLQSSNQGSGVCSSTSGKIHLLNIAADIEVVSEWQAHEYECWITIFDADNPRIIYSGGDDSKLHLWDVREHAKPAATYKEHTAGVCSIVKSLANENYLLCGSYDEKIDLIDTRSLKKPISQINVVGGVWRMKWKRPQKEESKGGDDHHLAVAAMHSGFHVVTLQQDIMRGIDLYNEHDSLAYGIDWLQTESSSNISYLVSCSFYDNKLSLWQWQANKDRKNF